MPVNYKYERERGEHGAPCTCGGYMDKVDEETPEDLKIAAERRYCACCVAVFVCRVCGDRDVIEEPAPDPGW
jgi:hypothetical protein